MAVATGTLRVAEIDVASCNWGQLVSSMRARRILAISGLGSLMVMTEVEKSPRSVMERMFYAKLGPTPSFPSSPAAQTEHGKPTK